MRAWWPLLILLLSQGVGMDSTVNSVHRWSGHARWIVVLQESPSARPVTVAPPVARVASGIAQAPAPAATPSQPLPGAPLRGSVDPRAGPAA